jgi:hypothetical protein
MQPTTLRLAALAALASLAPHADAQKPMKRAPAPIVASARNPIAPPLLRRLDPSRLRALNLASASLADLQTGPYSGWSAGEKLAVLANMRNRYGVLAPAAGKAATGKAATATAATGTAANGVRYTISRDNPLLPAASTGATSTTRSQDDFLVCRTTPLGLVRQFSGPLAVASLPSSQNQSVIYPGQLLRDRDVARGVFTPVGLARAAGSLVIDVFVPNGPVAVPVADLNDFTQVRTAVNTLLSGAMDASATTAYEYSEFVFRSSSQFNLEMEASTEANLPAAIGIPSAAGSGAASSVEGSLGFEDNVNVAVAALNQVYYTISLGGQGPSSTVQGAVPADVLCITDVQYGRRAFLMVGSYASRSEATLVASELVNVGTALGAQAQAEANLSSEARRALELGLVRVTIVGGAPLQAVRVNDLASLRQYIQDIDPSVAGVNAVPIAYTLRYASNNAPAKVGAFAELVDTECTRATRLKITLNSIKPTKVVDWGDEELFGSIKVVDSGNLASGQRSLWSREKSQAVQGRQNVAIAVNESGTFNLNSAIANIVEAEVEIELNDRIMGAPDPEFAGASAADRDRGHARYTRRTARVPLSELVDAPGAKLTRSFAVEEGEARVEVSLTFQILDV